MVNLCYSQTFKHIKKISSSFQGHLCPYARSSASLCPYRMMSLALLSWPAIKIISSPPMKQRYSRSLQHILPPQYPMPKYTSRWREWQQQMVLRDCSITNLFRKGFPVNWKEQKDTRKEFPFFWLI